MIAFFALFSTLAKAQTLTLGSVDAGPYTPGSSIAVPFTINNSGGCINPDNVFKLYISSVPGGTPNVEIGTYTGFYAAFLNGTIPAGLAPGLGYNLAVKSSLPAVTSNVATINIIAGPAVTAAIEGSSINSDNPEIFGNCSGSAQSYDFVNASTTGANVTATFKNEFNQTTSAPYTLNPNTSFAATTTNYTILVKATIGGTEGTKAYQLINNNLNTNFGTSGSNTVCLSNGKGTLSYTVDADSPNGIQYNYPGNLYIVNWGDGSSTIYTLCDIVALRGRLTHDYLASSCGMSSGSQANSYQVNAQVSSRICGALGSPTTVYAKVVRPPTNGFTAPNSACLGDAVTFTNTSDPGQDASNVNCVNVNARYAWYIDGQLVATNRPGSASFTYTFTTSGQHIIKLVLQSQSGSVCGADPIEKTICILAKPQPAFTVSSSTICSNGMITTTDGSVTDPSCNNIPANNVYNWTVTGPAATVFVDGTTSASHAPHIQFPSPGVYTLTLSISTESCGPVSVSQTITVNTMPTVSLSADKQYCGKNQAFTFANNAGDTQTLFTGTFSDQPNTYSWTVSGGGFSFINGTSASSKYPQIVFSDFAVYTVTATQTNNCGTASDSQQLTFLESPTINAGPDQTICPADVVQLNGTSTNPQPQITPTYQWVGGAGTFSPGRAALNAVYTPTAAEVNAGQVKLTLTSNTGYPQPCDQLSDEIIITINPRNSITSNQSQTICTGTNLNYQSAAQLSGSTFTWTSAVTSGTVSGNTSNTTGNSGFINDNLTGNGTVTYTITPFSTQNNVNCPGTSSTLVVTVTPRPDVVATPAATTICSDQAVNIALSSAANISGTTYKWTSIATAGISGNTNHVASSTNMITDNLSNASATVTGSVTYTIIAVGPSPNFCEGSPVTVTINVLPKPVVANAGSDASICASTSYTLNGNNPGISSGNWTFIPASGQNINDVTFVNASQYNTVVNGLQAGKMYTFRWTITGAAPCNATSDDVSINNLSPLINTISFGSSAVCYNQTITVTGDQPTGGAGTYAYSWQSSPDGVNNWTTISGAAGQNYSFTATQSIYIKRLISSLPCSSESPSIHIIVQQPIANNTIAADQTICYNNTPSILNGSTPTGGGNDFSYQWQSTIDNGANWNSINGATNINYQPVALTVTTQFRRIVTTSVCANDQKNISNIVTITVNPQNTNSITSDASRSICTGTSFTYHILARDANTSFTWVSSVTSGTVSGNTASGNTADINDRLTNADLNNNATVTYTITPANVINGITCPGVPFTVTVTVTPLPVITLNRSTNTICSGSQTDIAFSSNLNGTQFKWTTSATAGISGNQNQLTPVSVLRIDQTLINNSTSNGTVTYTITPVSASGCEGAPQTVTITVQPPPLQANAGNDDQICAASTYTLNGNNPAPFTGLWTVTSGQQNVVFANAAQYNTMVSGLQPGQQYTFRWTISTGGLCAPSSDDVTISNLQGLTNTISFGSAAICFGQTATVLGDTPTGGTSSFVYRWESSADGNTNWTVIPNQNNQNYTFTGSQSVYIRRVVSSGPCSSVSNSVYIVVQPAISNNNISADQTICYNNTPSILNGSTPTGANNDFIFQWQKSVDNGITWTNVGSAISNYQPDALTATTQFRRIVTSMVCSGDQKNISNTVTITVNALNTNTLTSDASRIICTGTTFSYHPTAQQTGTSFTWTSSATVNISGNTINGSGDINDVLINSDPNQNGQVTYTITPINYGCPGVPFTLTVTVTPIPRIILTNTGKAICSGNPTGITFTTSTPDVMVKWTTDNVQGISGNKNQFAVIATRIDDVLTSTLTVPATITYHLTPVSPGGCEGPTVDATVTVLPQPVTANAGANEAICSASTYTLRGNNPAPSTGKWTLISGQTGVGFADATLYNTAVSGLQPGQQYAFRWTITSTGGCSTSADDVMINNLRDLTNNISFSSPAVCSGQTISILGDIPTGATGNFVYAWESSSDNVNWTTISGQTGQNYSFTGTQNIYVRRIVSSGPCTKISAPVYIIVQPPITNNTVASDQEVCYNNTPKLLVGSTPSGADNNYSFQWQNSVDNGQTWSNISGATAQNYQVNSLTVTTIFRRVVTSVLCNGPQQSFSNIITVTVNPLPNAVFTYAKDLGCIPFVLDAQNIKATNAPGNNTYTWYADGVLIGTGFTFPGYIIRQDDIKVEIKLVVSSKFGCPDAVFTHNFTTIKEVSTSFTQNQTKGCGPLSVIFTNTSNPQSAATYSWNFGNGVTSTLANPAAVTYLARTDGKDTTYNVTLRAFTTCGIRMATSTITVRPKPISIFSPDKTTGCSPLTINFNNTSPGINNTYTYDFGDGQTLVTHDNQKVNHTYIAANNKVFTVKMTAENECGKSVTQYNISISPNTVLPQLIVNGNQKAGCAPWTVQFYNNTTGATYFTYDFGDGTKVNSQSAPEIVSHTFLKGGLYNVKMTATNGCSDTAAYQAITVYDQPATNFTSDIQRGCRELNVSFKNLTPGSNNYLWDFGDGSTSNLPNPAHTFAASTSPYTITLIAKNTLGCTDTITMKDYINVSIPPKAAFNVNPDSVIVYPRYNFSFADKSTANPILWKWNFGDGTSSSRQNPEHTYRDTGRYTVKLVVYNLQGCADSIVHKVQITGTPGQLFVPNAFMPTSKFPELTTFKIKGSGLKTWRFRVFNKWGQVIWETTKLTEKGEPVEGWDGMMAGQPAPQGVYVWQVEGTYINGNEWKGMSYNGGAPSRQGIIHLIR